MAPIRKRYTDKQIEFLRKTAKIQGMTAKKITELFNKEFNEKRTVPSISYIRSEYGIALNNPRSIIAVGTNKRGSKPIGTERVRKGYVEIKVEQPNVWNQKHRHIWEQHHKKKLGHNEIVIFLDKNNRNFDIENLAMISRDLMGIMNMNDWVSENPQHTKVGINLAKLSREIYTKGEVN